MKETNNFVFENERPIWVQSSSCYYQSIFMIVWSSFEYFSVTSCKDIYSLWCATRAYETEK